MSTITENRVLTDAHELAQEPKGTVVESYFGSRYRSQGDGTLIAEAGGSGGSDAYGDGSKVNAGQLEPPFTVVEEPEPDRVQVGQAGVDWSYGTYVRSALSGSPQRLVIESEYSTAYINTGDASGANSDGAIVSLDDLKAALTQELGWNILTDDDIDDLVSEQADERIALLGLVEPPAEPDTYSMEVEYTTGTGSDVINDVVQVRFDEDFVVFVGPEGRLEFMAPTRTVQSIARI